jgi:Ca-activated chloride channel family protein
MKAIARLFLVMMLYLSHDVNAQSSDKLIHDGNKLYEQKKYGEAELNYRKSLNTKENPFIGNYNLGNTYYQLGKLDEAKQQYETAASMKSASPDQLSKAYHNLGNALLKNKKFEESINAYKQSLKLNPKDNDTRYNLAYAQSMLQQQQQQQKQNKDKDNKNNKDQDKKNQDSKDQQQQKDDQQQKEEQAKQQKEDKEQQQQARKDKISKEDAEKILQALNNEERKTQKKLNVKETAKVMIDKEW